MKKTILPLIFVLTAITFCTGQKIKMEKAFGGYKYTQNGQKMGMGDLVKIMENNQPAYKLIKEAQSSNTLATIIGSAGGFLVGWPLGSALGGGEANWTLAAVGAGLIVVGIPISSSVNKKAKSAVEIYNSSLDTSSYYEYSPKVNLIASGNGIGFSMTF